MQPEKVLLCIGLAFITIGANAQQAVGTPIKIGIIFPLTGGSADVGNSALIGAKVAVKEINSAIGFMGRPLELVIRNDEAKNDLGLQHAQELVLKEKVAATVGFCNTGVAMKALDVFQANKSVLMVPCATGTPITKKYPAAQSYVFRTSARSQLQAKFLVDEIVRRKLTKIAVLADDTGYGDAGVKDIEDALASAHLKTLMVTRFKLAVTTLEPELRQMRDAGADALIGWTVGPEQGVISSSRTAIGWTVPQYGAWDLSNASAFTFAGGRVDGVVMVQTVLPNIFLERNNSFLRAYKSLDSGKMIGSFMAAAQSYDTIHLLLRAMFDAKGDLSGPAIKKALENQANIYRGVVTTYDHPFTDKDHEALTANMLWLGTWRNQDREYLYSEDQKLATMIRRKQPS